MSNVVRRPRRILAACIAAAGLSALVAGCASPYGQNTLFGGYKSEKLDASHWRVQYDGNGHTPREQVWAYWIYRCAEVTRQNGYSYFAMLPSEWTPPPAPPAAASAVHAAWQPAPRGAWQARSAVWRIGDDPGRVQARSSGGGYTYMYIPGSTVTVTTWHTKGVVAMFNAPVAPDTLLVMSAQSVLDDLGPYVQGTDKHPLDRDLLVQHGLHWVNESGAVMPMMTPPAAAASAPRAPVRLAPPAVRQGGLAS
jgi:hypothetical protein